MSDNTQKRAYQAFWSNISSIPHQHFVVTEEDAPTSLNEAKRQLKNKFFAKYSNDDSSWPEPHAWYTFTMLAVPDSDVSSQDQTHMAEVTPVGTETISELWAAADKGAAMLEIMSNDGRLQILSGKPEMKVLNTVRAILNKHPTVTHVCGSRPGNKDALLAYLVSKYPQFETTLTASLKEYTINQGFIDELLSQV